MKIKFCGAAQTVTGSCHLLTLDDGYKILLDCGLFQGHQAYIDEYNQKWHFDPREIDVVVLSHAHIDHSGRLPKLVKDGFRGKIVCTKATADVSAIMLRDSASIQEKDSEYHNKKRAAKNESPLEPLYTIKDAEFCITMLEPHSYNTLISIHPDVEIEFRDAGHILGSANVTLEIKRKNGKTTRLGFTGDIGRPERPILRNPQPMEDLDYIISESTYGNRSHGPNTENEKAFWDVIYETCYQRRGKVIIPAFSLGRTQELVYLLDKMHHFHKINKIPVYVDSPLSCKATDIYRDHTECFDEEIKKYLQVDANPFGFEDLEYISDVNESKALNENQDPCIIISASGMAEAGRIVHHIRNNIENPRNAIMLVGYASEGSLARRIKDGNSAVKIFGEYKTVQAQISIMDSFSAHGDCAEMTNFLNATKNQRLKKTFLVHGDPEVQEDFRTHLQSMDWGEILIPSITQEFEL